jgi:hypothetical protein
MCLGFSIFPDAGEYHHTIQLLQEQMANNGFWPQTRINLIPESPKDENAK